MPQTEVAKPRSAAGRRAHRSRHRCASLRERAPVEGWSIEEIAKLRLFRAGHHRYARDIAALAASIGRRAGAVKTAMWRLPAKPCFASAAVIDDGPLTFAERMALIWDEERKP